MCIYIYRYIYVIVIFINLHILLYSRQILTYVIVLFFLFDLNVILVYNCVTTLCMHFVDNLFHVS